MSTKNVQRVGWLIAHCLWVVVAIVAVSFVIAYAVPETMYGWFSTPLGSLVLTALIYLLAAIVVVLPMVIVQRPSLARLLTHVGLHTPPKLAMLPWALFAWGLYFASTLVVMIGVSLLPISGLDLSQQQDVGFTNLRYGYEFVAAFVALVVLAPLFEEVIFRGYLYGRLRKYSGVVLSALLTSALFALVHFQWNVSIDVFVLSLFLCFLREKFNSVWPGVFVHAFKNGIAYTLLFILPLYGINLIQ